MKRYKGQKRDKQLPEELKKFMWPKGVSGNPAGRPKGKTLKEFAREYLEQLPEDEKRFYLAGLPPEIVWKMAEGNPATTTDITSKGEAITGNTIILRDFNGKEENGTQEA